MSFDSTRCLLFFKVSERFCAEYVSFVDLLSLIIIDSYFCLYLSLHLIIYLFMYFSIYLLITLSTLLICCIKMLLILTVLLPPFLHHSSPAPHLFFSPFFPSFHLFILSTTSLFLSSLPLFSPFHSFLSSLLFTFSFFPPFPSFHLFVLSTISLFLILISFLSLLPLISSHFLSFASFLLLISFSPFLSFTFQGLLQTALAHEAELAKRYLTESLKSGSILRSTSTIEI